jgi:hypothetical protein
VVDPARRLRLLFERLKSAAVNSVFEQVLVPICSDDDRQRFLKIRTYRGGLARIEDRDGQDSGNNGRLTVVREFSVFQARFPPYELPLGEGMKLVQAVGKLLEFAAAQFGRGISLWLSAK